VPALGLLLAPLIRLCGALGVYNALMGMATPLAGFATYLAARELTHRTWPAVAAGLLLAVMPYQAGQNIGHLNLCFSAAVPAALFVTLRAHRCGWQATRLAICLALLLAFAFGVSQELFTSLVLFGAGLAGLLAWRHPPARPALRALTPGLAGGLCLAVLSIAPILWEMWREFPGSGQIPEPLFFSADLLGFVIPNPLIWLGGQACRPITDAFTGNYTEQDGYLGVPLIVLLLVIARGPGLARVIVLAAGCAGVLSLGPFLQIAGLLVSTAPWLALYHVPLLHDLLPARFALYMDLAVACAAALWLARPGRWRFAVLALCALPLLPSQSADRAWTRLALPPAIAALPDGARLMILPLFGQEMGLQYLDNMRFTLVAQGYLGSGLPRPFTDWPLYGRLWHNQFAAVDPASFAGFLSTYGAQYVAVLPAGYGEEAGGPAAAGTLLINAGWRAATVTPQATIYTPAGPPLRSAPPPPVAGPAMEAGPHRRTVVLTVIALISALLVWAEARFRARRADAAAWLVAVFLAWIVAGPAYALIRLSRAWRSRS